GELELDVLHVEQLGVLLHQRVLRFDEDLHQRRLVEVEEGRDHRQAADEFGDEAEFQQVLGFAMLENLTGLALVGRGDMSAEAHRLALHAVGNDLFQARERAAADEQYIGRVDLQEFLLRMLAAALRRDRSGRTFHQLEERLLNALARNVAGDRWIVGFAANLVDLVDVDYPPLRLLDI